MELEQLDEKQCGRFCDLIYVSSGIRVDDRKIILLSNRIRRRLKAGGFKNFEEYYQFLTSRAGAAELEHFLDAITTNETFFFRTKHHFEWFKSVFIPDAIAEFRRGERDSILRIWSAGCATGAEPYSIAICLAENMFRLKQWSLEITGTDISEEALRNARLGVFEQRAMETVSEKQRRRFFQPVNCATNWQIRSNIREMVDFNNHNLLKPFSKESQDCIFIRNVLIYFDRESKQVVIEHLTNALAHGGYLVIGPSEGIYDMLGPLKRLSTFLYQKI